MDYVPQFEMLTPLQCQLRLILALRALQPQHNLLGGLGLLVEHWFRLTTVTRLFAVITTFSLRYGGGLGARKDVSLDCAGEMLEAWVRATMSLTCVVRVRRVKMKGHIPCRSCTV